MFQEKIVNMYSHKNVKTFQEEENKIKIDQRLQISMYFSFK